MSREDSEEPFLQRDGNKNSDTDDTISLIESESGSLNEQGKSQPFNWSDRLIQVVIYDHAGIKLLFLAQMFGAAMTACAKVLENTVDPPLDPLQLIFCRMSVTYLSSIAYMHHKKVENKFFGPKEVRGLLFFRGLLGFGGLYCYYYACNYLPLSDVSVLNYLTPPLTSVVAYFFLKEPLTRKLIIGSCLAIMGVIIIAKPSSLLHGSDDEEPGKGQHRTTAVAVSFLGSAITGVVYCIIRKIGLRAHALMSVTYFSMWSTIPSFFALLFVPGLAFVLPASFTAWCLIFLLGIVGFVYQFMLTAGFQRTSAGIGASVSYTSIMWAHMWNAIIFHDKLDGWSIVGSIIILGAATWITFGKEDGRTITSASTQSLDSLPSEDLEDEIESI